MSRKLMAMMLAIGLVIGLVGGFFGGYYYKNFRAADDGGGSVGGGGQAWIGVGLVNPISIFPATPTIHKIVHMKTTKDLSNPFTCPSDIPAKHAMPFHLNQSDNYFSRGDNVPFIWLDLAVQYTKIINPDAGKPDPVGIENVYKIREDNYPGGGVGIFAVLTEQYHRTIKSPDYFYQMVDAHWNQYFSEQDLTGPTKRGDTIPDDIGAEITLCSRPGTAGTGGGSE